MLGGICAWPYRQSVLRSMPIRPAASRMLSVRPVIAGTYLAALLYALPHHADEFAARFTHHGLLALGVVAEGYSTVRTNRPDDVRHGHQAWTHAAPERDQYRGVTCHESPLWVMPNPGGPTVTRLGSSRGGRQVLAGASVGQKILARAQ
jgi:hypothetical protein